MSTGQVRLENLTEPPWMNGKSLPLHGTRCRFESGRGLHQTLREESWFWTPHVFSWFAMKAKHDQQRYLSDYRNETEKDPRSLSSDIMEAADRHTKLTTGGIKKYQKHKYKWKYIQLIRLFVQPERNSTPEYSNKEGVPPVFRSTRSPFYLEGTFPPYVFHGL